MNDDERKHMEDLEELLLRFETEGFTHSKDKNDIHHPDAIRFYKRFCEIDEWTLKVLTYGLDIEVRGRVGQYEDDNNRSARRNMEILRSKVEEWEKAGKLHEVRDKPMIVSPMSVVEKVDWNTGDMKYRPVIDHSRHVNLFIEDKPCKLNDLNYFDPIIEKDMYMTSYDLRSMYHHVKLTDKTKELFGFKIPQEKGGDKYYKFDVLMFGSKPASWVTSKLLKPAVNYFRAHGIKTGIFVDDGALLNINPRVLVVETKFVLTVLQLLGWNVNWEKTEARPSQIMTYQGFQIDTVKMEYRLPEGKVAIICDIIDKVLDKAQQASRVQAKELGSLFGKVISARRSHGPGVQIALRHSQHVLGKQVMHRGIEEFPDWSVSVVIDKQMASELVFIKKHMKDWNGHPIPSDRTVHVFNVNNTEFVQKEPWTDQNQQYSVMVSDASDRVAFVYEAEQFKLVEEFGFSEQEQRMGSGQRELRAVMKAVTDKAEFFRSKPGRVYWITDAKNVYYFLKRGSRKSHIQQDVMVIKKMEKNLGIQIIPIWQPRDTLSIVLADMGSKAYQSTDEWSVDKYTFKHIQKTMGIKVTIDAFATSANALCTRFYSKYPQVGSMGINFFAQTLVSEEIYWVCPPVTQVVRAIKHMLDAKCRVIGYVSFPEWVSGNYWTFVTRSDRFAPFVRAVFYSKPVFQSFNEASNVFRGRKKFRFITVLINSQFRDNNVYR